MRLPACALEEWEFDGLWHRLVIWYSGNLSVQYYEPATGIWCACWKKGVDYLVVFDKETEEMVSGCYDGVTRDIRPPRVATKTRRRRHRRRVFVYTKLISRVCFMHIN